MALMIFITGCCVLLGGLSALGTSPLNALVGFVAVPLFCAAMIGVIELFSNRAAAGRGSDPFARPTAPINAPPRPETGNPYQTPGA